MVVSLVSVLYNVYMKDCSLVTASCRVGGREIGRIGVIGPTRMEYDRVVAVLEFISGYITGMMDK